MSIPLRQSTTATLAIGPFVDLTDGVTPEVGLTAGTVDEIGVYKHNGTALVDISGTTTFTHRAGGIYTISLSTTDTNTLGRLKVFVRDDSVCLPVWLDCEVMTANAYDSEYGGSTNRQVDVVQWNGTNVATPSVAGVPEVDLTHMGGASQSAIDLKNFADSGYDPATQKVQGVVLVDTVSALASDSVDSSALASSAVLEIRQSFAVATGTADSGSTTTLVDAARTEADTDYWKGCIIRFTSGTISGQVRLITGFDPGTDTITFAPATTQAVATNTYEIYPAGRVDLQSIQGDEQSATDLKDFADAGYDPATNKVQGVVLVDTTTTNTDMRGTDSAALASVCTEARLAELDAANIPADLDAVLVDTADMQPKLGTITDLGGGATIGANLTDIEAQTDDIGAAGAGLTAIPWNAAWDAEVESEVNDALDTAIAELSQAAPTATPTLRTALMLLYMMARNKLVVQTSGTDAIEVYNDAGTLICKKLITDDGSDYNEAEMVAGP